MSGHSINLEENAIIRASDQIGIRVVSPFILRHNRVEFIFTAWITDFGGPKGMLVVANFYPPGPAASRVLRDAAHSLGCGVSFINIPRDESSDWLIDACEDWGYCGSPNMRPKWLK